MRTDHRAKPRRPMRYQAWLQTAPGAAAQPCRLSDVSEDGARLAIDGAMAMPTEVNLFLAENSEGRLCRVMWRSDTEIGIRFNQSATIGNARRKR